jgi:hypothetical protein
VQSAYDANSEPWWQEGTAQWAAKQVYPDLMDLERFLPAYFDAPWRPLNVPPGGVVTNFLYGTAIWPVFLDERYGAPLILNVFQELDSSSEGVLETTGRVLSAQGGSLAGTFLEFATSNAATAERATPGQGYQNAAAYPAVPLTPFAATPGASLSEVAAGLGAYYYSLTVTEPVELQLEADAERIAAVLLPIAADGTVDLSAAQTLPATAEQDALLVVAGQSLARTDAPFTVRAEAMGSSEDSTEPGGCALAAGKSGRASSNWLLLLALLGARRPLKGRR